MTIKKIGILFPLVAISCFLINATLTLYLPSLPSIMQYFHTTEQYVKNTLSYFLLGSALASLIYGPMSDIIGRRKVLLMNHIIYILGSLVSLFSWSIGVLLAGRFIEGIGIGGCLSVGMAACSDISSGKELAKKYSLLSMFIGMSPAISPFIGGYIQFYFGWRYVFATLAVASFLVFVVMLVFYPESHSTKDQSMKHIRLVSQHIASFCKYPRFLFFPYMAGLIYIGMNITFQAYPFFIVHQLGYSPKQFGWYNFFIGIGFVIGTQLVRILSRRLDKFKLFILLYISILCLSIVGLCWFWFAYSIYSLMFFGILYFTISGGILPIAMSLAMDQVSRCRGSASSVYAFVFMLCGFLGVVIFASFSTVSGYTYALFMLVISCLALCSLGIYHYKVNRVNLSN